MYPQKCKHDKLYWWWWLRGPNNKNALYIYGCFLQLRKLLEVSYCNCCYWTWLRFTTVYNFRSMSNGQNHLRRPSRNRARLCFLCSRLDWLPLGFGDVNKHTFYETNDSSYYIQNVWVNEMFFKKVNQLPLAMSIRVTYLLLSIYHILNMWPVGMSLLSYPTLFYHFFHNLKMPWLFTRTEGNNVHVTCDLKYLKRHEII